MTICQGISIYSKRAEMYTVGPKMIGLKTHTFNHGYGFWDLKLKDQLNWIKKFPKTIINIKFLIYNQCGTIRSGHGWEGNSIHWIFYHWGWLQFCLGGTSIISYPSTCVNRSMRLATGTTYWEKALSSERDHWLDFIDNLISGHDEFAQTYHRNAIRPAPHTSDRINNSASHKKKVAGFNDRTPLQVSSSRSHLRSWLHTVAAAHRSRS